MAPRKAELFSKPIKGLKYKIVPYVTKLNPPIEINSKAYSEINNCKNLFLTEPKKTITYGIYITNIETSNKPIELGKFQLYKCIVTLIK